MKPQKGHKLVGYTLSCCIEHIISGDVNQNDVLKIVSNTKADGPRTWDGVISLYRKAYWYRDPDHAETLVRQFITEGKIEQPRLTDPSYTCPTTEFWVEVPDPALAEK